MTAIILNECQLTETFDTSTFVYLHTESP